MSSSEISPSRAPLAAVSAAEFPLMPTCPKTQPPPPKKKKKKSSHLEANPNAVHEFLSEWGAAGGHTSYCVPLEVKKENQDQK